MFIGVGMLYARTGACPAGELSAIYLLDCHLDRAAAALAHLAR